MTKSTLKQEIDALNKQIDRIYRDAKRQAAPLKERIEQLYAMDFAEHIDPQYGLVYGEKREASEELINEMIERGWSPQDIGSFITFTCVGVEARGWVELESVYGGGAVFPPKLVATCKVVKD